MYKITIVYHIVENRGLIFSKRKFIHTAHIFAPVTKKKDQVYT